jgi:N-methylhydantoinase B
MQIDPITFAVVKNGLDAIVDEVAYTVLRTARSEIVKDVMDYSAALCDREGRMVAQAKTVALHLGAIPEAMAEVLKRYRDDLHPGDAIILNDPYGGGMHLPDIFMFYPIFHAGKLQGFSVVICHHTDIGGRVAGSNASDSTEIYQEGLRIPVLKLYSAGVLNETLRNIIELNVRVPDRVLGDLFAQYAACQVGSRELGKLCDIYGPDLLQEYLSSLLDYSEQMSRDEIRHWPKGTFRFTDYIDDDGMDDSPIPISVAITVHEDSLTVDFEGTSPQVRGAINATLSYTHSCTYLSVRCALKGDVPNNAGIFRCIDVKVPDGSVLNPLPPAAVAARALTGYRLCDAMFGALAQIVPNRIPAAGEGGNTVVCLAGLRPNREPFIIVDMICGAWGGRPDKDGIDAITNPSQNLSNTPVETLEAQFPIRIEEYGFVRDSCGAGLWRGGLGVRRSYRLLADEAQLQLRSDRAKFPPYGLNGGQPGLATMNHLVIDGEQTSTASKVTMSLKRDSVLIHEQAGGGGFGDALARDPERVSRDVWNGKISSEYAEQWHGVVFDPQTNKLSQTRTDELRRQRRLLNVAAE